MDAIVKTAKNFIKSVDFVNGIISSTKAGFGGSGYSVELFADGHWRVMWDNQIGNLYNSPGMIVRLPQCSDEDIACKNPDCVANGCTCGWDWESEVRADDYKDEFMADMLA
jgi:hypothetical protein